MGINLRSWLAVTVVVVLVAVGAAARPSGDDSDFVVTKRVYAQDGTLAAEIGYMKARPEISFERHFTHKPNHPGGGGGPGGGGADPGTDCESDNSKGIGYKWLQPYSAKATDFASVFDASGNTWDAQTGADIFASITAGNDGVAGELDDVNQLAFVNLGASTTIAVTTTWYFTQSGEAVESDGQYNTFYSWATNGDPNSMDVENIGTHEVGHTFGLDHPKGNPGQISCLTMYAFADEGETQKRTLGDGDILGIQNLYGA